MFHLVVFKDADARYKGLVAGLIPDPYEEAAESEHARFVTCLLSSPADYIGLKSRFPSTWKRVPGGPGSFVL
jgi:hypothetical protein